MQPWQEGTYDERSQREVSTSFWPWRVNMLEEAKIETQRGKKEIRYLTFTPSFI